LHEQVSFHRFIDEDRMGLWPEQSNGVGQVQFTNQIDDGRLELAGSNDSEFGTGDSFTHESERVQRPRNALLLDKVTAHQDGPSASGRINVRLDG